MKALFSLFFALSLLATRGFAQTQNTEIKGHKLTVFAEAGEKFFLVLDGQKQNDKPQARVIIPVLDRPYYKGRIIFDDERIKDLDQLIQLEGVDLGFNDVVYVVKKKVKKKKTYYVCSPYSFVALTRPKGTANEDRVLKQDVPDYSDPNNLPPIPQPSVVVIQPPTPEQPPAINPLPTPPAPPAAPACSTAISPADFMNAMRTIKAQNFEADRLKVSKQVLGYHCLNTSQVLQVMGMFGFEESRLDFAKAAYAKTIDRQQYYLVNEGLKFSSSKDELNDFVLAGGK